MPTLRRLESNDLKALKLEAAKYSDWYLVGKLPTPADGPPYVILMRDGYDALPEEETSLGKRTDASICARHGAIIESGCPDCEAALDSRLSRVE